MAKPLAKVYANAVKKNQKILYGVWEPGFPVQLGDYGVMKGNIFTQLGNISEFEELKNFKLKIRKDETKDEKFFTSQKGVQFTLTPKGEVPIEGVELKASIEVKFSKKNCVFFNAAECTFESIENKYQLGQELLKLGNGRWKKKFVVVTDRVIAKRALVLISTSSDFSIKLDAKADIDEIDLASASLGFTLNNQKSSGYKVITEEGIIPLIGLSKIKSPFLFFGNKFKASHKEHTAEMTSAIIDNELEETDNKELQFSQLTDDLDE